MAVAPCGTLYDPPRPLRTVTERNRLSRLSRLLTAPTPTAPAHTTARNTAWIAVPTAYAVRLHRSPAPVTHPSTSVTNRHPPVTARPNPGVSPRPSFRISHAVWHSVTSGETPGRG
ncbi:hypothetical protein GCM10010280_54370 [Streptomyces pilosus]|uniref:Uncharacterized protein n=1 Tax=Streptomyces pilosus TaxID=28893 RepID=A0A918BZA8_9ACTN|nr:hypothetical protein GCM10010280_54370 [Streptomyces pilosus]